MHTVFASAGAQPAISSTKALTGHGLSMASVMETAFCAVALADGFIPGQAHLVNPDPESADLNLPRTTLDRAATTTRITPPLPLRRPLAPPLSESDRLHPGAGAGLVLV